MHTQTDRERGVNSQTHTKTSRETNVHTLEAFKVVPHEEQMHAAWGRPIAAFKISV